jgi:hypothetical protein
MWNKVVREVRMGKALSEVCVGEIGKKARIEGALIEVGAKEIGERSETGKQGLLLRNLNN